LPTLQLSGTPIAGRYIVGFKNSVTDVDHEARRLELRHRGVLRMTYKSALKGMTLSLSDAAADSLRNDPNVAFVEQDRTISMANVSAAGGWGLDRVDQRALPLNSTYSYSADGTGVTAYILDSGINFTHTEFGGRASTGTDIMTPGGTAVDCHGHGSTVSGVVGGATYGIAKKVKLVAVRVVDCNGNSANSTTIAGIDWVTAHRVLPAVANLSLQNVYSAALNQSIAKRRRCRRDLRRRGWQQQRRRVLRVAVQRPERDRRRRHGHQRRLRELLQLRTVRHAARSRREHPGAEHRQQHRHEDVERNVVLLTARHWPGRAVPPVASDGDASSGPRMAGGQRHDERDQECSQRNAQPPRVLSAVGCDQLTADRELHGHLPHAAVHLRCERCER
jgi:hypothetical protein